MKNKRVTYLLLAGVILVWGYALLQVFSALSGDEEEAFQFQPPGNVAIEDTIQDFALLNNYPDPFFKTKIYQKVKSLPPASVSKKVDQKVKVEPNEAPDFTFIKYLGLIFNKEKDKNVALMSVHGNQFFVSSGDTISGIIFAETYRDSVKVSFKGKSYYLKK